MSDKTYNKTYNGFVKTLGGPARLVFGVKSFGKENVPSDRGVIVCANHTAFECVSAICIGEC